MVCGKPRGRDCVTRQGGGCSLSPPVAATERRVCFPHKNPKTAAAPRDTAARVAKHARVAALRYTPAARGLTGAQVTAEPATVTAAANAANEASLTRRQLTPGDD